MAKFKSSLKSLGKNANRMSSKVRRKGGSLLGDKKKKAVKSTRKSLYGSKIKGKNILKGTGKKIGPIRADLKGGGIRKINRLVETRVQNLVPKLSEKIEAKVDSFDPNKFMGKIFDGGLDSLRGFGSSLDGMKGSLGKTVDFISKASELAGKFIDKLSKAKAGKGGGGFFKTMIKGVALAGVAALAVPAIANVALFGGAVTAGKNLFKGGLDFIKGRFKKKKKEKKKEETKIKKDKKNLFKGVLEKFGNTLNFLNPLGKGKKTQTIKSEMSKRESISSEDGFREGYNVSILNKEGRKGQIYTLKIDKHNGKVIGGPDNEVTRAITDKLDEKDDLSKRYRENKKMGKRDDSDKAEAKKLKEQINTLRKDIRELMMAGGEGIEVKDVKRFKGKGLNLEAIVEKGEAGEKGKKGVDGKKGGLGSFIQNTTSNVKNVAGQIVKSTPQYKLFSLVKENKENIKKIAAGAPKTITQQVGKAKKKGDGLWDKVKGGAGWLAGGLKGMVNKALGLRKEMSKEIAQPAQGGKGGGGGEGQVVPLQMPVAKGKKAPKQAVMQKSKPANKVPALMPIDQKNIHVPYAKSTFNIVDAM